MTLAQRILLSISLLVVGVTVGLSVAVQHAWETTAEEEFSSALSSGTARLKQQLAEEITQLHSQLQPLCRHGQMVDSTLTALQAGSLDRERKYALSLLVPETLQAFHLDELVLFTSDGEVLGAHQAGLVGRTDPKYARLAKAEGPAKLQTAGDVLKIEAHCRKARGKYAVGLYAAKHFDSILERVGALHGLLLSRTPPQDRPERFIRVLDLEQLGDATVFASPKHMTVQQAIRRLNLQILQWGALVLLVALSLGFWFARRLSQPIVELSKQAQKVVAGEAQPIRARGGRELREFARSFNQTLDDLTKLRSRLAATERIAAQREIARRVAHEIKNPLAPIRAAIETLRRLRRRNDPAFDDYFNEATETVLSEVARITTIVREFTEFARLPSPKPIMFDFEQVIRQVVKLHEREGIALWLTTVGPAPIRADRDQCIQVVTNLLQNALDAVSGRANPTVHVALETTGNYTQVSIADNGPGVPPDLWADVFRPYVTTKASGTGLGLAIVQRIVVEHGGEAMVTRSEMGGAKFIIRLPVDGPGVLLDTTI